tara:strand:- start:4317 stop:4424 length:108 start_codon:yes stop_codon:yes gene_type:complete
MVEVRRLGGEDLQKVAILRMECFPSDGRDFHSSLK